MRLVYNAKISRIWVEDKNVRGSVEITEKWQDMPDKFIENHLKLIIMEMQDCSYEDIIITNYYVK